LKLISLNLTKERCVKALGKKKSLELLYATEDIQEKGGMLTSVINLYYLKIENKIPTFINGFYFKDNRRKRSPGGVYFQLIKQDETILNAQRKQIFIEDEIKKKQAKKLKRLRQRARFNEAKKNLQEQIGLKSESSDQSNNSSTAVLNLDQSKSLNGVNNDIENVNEEEMIYFDE
jgi:phosphorylated adapter RNA export protein